MAKSKIQKLSDMRDQVKALEEEVAAELLADALDALPGAGSSIEKLKRTAKKQQRRRTKITPVLRKAIEKDLKKGGVSDAKIAKARGVSSATVQRIKTAAKTKKKK